MLIKILLPVFILFCIAFAYAYWREWQVRKRPFYKKTVRDWAEKLPPSGKSLFSIAILGDTGAVCTDGSDPVLNLLQVWLRTAKKNSHVLFLGDNIYPKGLPPRNDSKRELSEARIKVQLEVFKNYQGKVTYLSGNHDWNKGRKEGFSYVLRQESYILNFFGYPEAYLPPKGCPGPVSLQLAPGILLVVLNTQWFVQKGIRPLGEIYECAQDEAEDFYTQLDTILQENQHQRILIAAHHPLYSNALHGGKFTLKQHLFPLTAAHKKVFIPLPVAGSLYPLFRKIFGAHEDMAHPRYKKMRKKLLSILSKYQNLVYAAGHDHNLQYFGLNHNHFIISGSGSKTTFVKQGGSVNFAHEHLGFFVLDYYDSETWLRALEPGENHQPVEIFRTKL